MTKRIAIIGGGIAGVTVAWQLAQHDRQFGGLEVALYEASSRLGGTVQTVLRDGFVVECGPDGWITEKPWARELARELGLHAKLIASNDSGRVTYVLRDGRLIPMPDGMRMMVPTNLAALADSPLFTPSAIAACAAEPARAAELKASAPTQDESIATFVQRHFGDEVLTKVAAPLLSGVFGGDVRKLSVRAVMPAFVRMEREHGSLILALQSAQEPGAPLLASEMCHETTSTRQSVFSTLELGTQSLIDRMAAELPPDWLRLSTPVTGLVRSGNHWHVTSDSKPETFDAIILATPASATSALLAPISTRIAELLPADASSALIAALAFDRHFDLPPGFGFLVPPTENSPLLAATFVDQKFPGRVPPGCRLLRAFFGGEQANTLAATRTDAEIAALAHAELSAILGTLPAPAFHVVRYWPRSLPQYEVGHRDRIAELEALVHAQPNLHLVGNAYRGVGLPDLVRDARTAARELIAAIPSF